MTEELKYMAWFERFEIELTHAQALSAAHPGDCEPQVQALLKADNVIEQLNKIDPGEIRAELSEYGAWDEAELADDQANRSRVVWIAAGNIREEYKL